MWKAKDQSKEARIVEAKEEKEKKRRNKRKAKKGEVNRGQEDSRRIGDFGWERESSKVREKSKNTGTRTFSQIDLCFWKETK